MVNLLRTAMCFPVKLHRSPVAHVTQWNLTAYFLSPCCQYEARAIAEVPNITVKGRLRAGAGATISVRHSRCSSISRLTEHGLNRRHREIQLLDTLHCRRHMRRVAAHPLQLTGTYSCVYASICLRPSSNLQSVWMIFK